MRSIRTIGAGAALLAMAVAALPAQAGDGDRRRGRGHRGDRIDAGDVALGAVLIGGLLALSSSSRRPRDVPPPPRTTDYSPEDVATRGGPPRIPIEEMTADDAADACGAAAESFGARSARLAQVMSVSAADRAGDRWFVSGTLRLRDGYRDTGGRTEAFRCSIGSQGVPDVRLAGDADPAPHPAASSSTQ